MLTRAQWLDNTLFGWSRHTPSRRTADSRRSSAPQSRADSEDDGADFDETVSLIPKGGSASGSESGVRRRRSSGRSSRSQADLGKLTSLRDD